VDVILHGHVHSYERTYPVHGNYTTASNASVDKNCVHKNGADDVYLDPAYPVHVVSGAAGNGESIDQFTGEGASRSRR
jgi:hypothetical protein